jgi:allantoin racemase
LSWVHVITPIVTTGFRVAALPAPNGCRVTNSQIKQGPASIESAVDEVLAAPGVVNSAIKAEKDGVQAVVIDCMLDPGLDAAREAVSIPVIGCGEAAMRAAGTNFAIVTVLQRQERTFADLARRYGMADRMTEIDDRQFHALDWHFQQEAFQRTNHCPYLIWFLFPRSVATAE